MDEILTLFNNATTSEAKDDVVNAIFADITQNYVPSFYTEPKIGTVKNEVYASAQ